jgi:hypothetical protein
VADRGPVRCRGVSPGGDGLGLHRGRRLVGSVDLRADSADARAVLGPPGHAHAVSGPGLKAGWFVDKRDLDEPGRRVGVGFAPRFGSVLASRVGLGDAEAYPQ